MSLNSVNLIKGSDDIKKWLLTQIVSPEEVEALMTLKVDSQSSSDSSSDQ